MRTTRRLLSTALFTTSLLAASAASADEKVRPAPSASDSPHDLPPPPEPAAPRATHMRSEGLVVGGAVIAAAGTLSLIAGAALAASSGSSSPTSCLAYCPSTGNLAGLALVGVGIATLIPGAIMIGVGADQVPGASAPAHASLGIGPSGISFSARF